MVSETWNAARTDPWKVGRAQNLRRERSSEREDGQTQLIVPFISLMESLSSKQTLICS